MLMAFKKSPDRTAWRGTVFRRIGLALLMLALGACQVPPDSANDHPYRHMPSGPDDY
jgi:hypothetical protein